MLLPALLFAVLLFPVTPRAKAQAWPQMGANPRHTGAVGVLGQLPRQVLARFEYDPFAKAAQEESGDDLTAHYQAPLVDGQDVFMMFKSGEYVPCKPPGSARPFPCGPDAWNRQVWEMRSLQWRDGKLEPNWTFQSDWKPAPNSDGLSGWEPVFHAALDANGVWVPAAGGDVFQLQREDGAVIKRHQPFGTAISAARVVVSPITVDGLGNAVYNVIEFNTFRPWALDVIDAWIVKVAPDGSITKASYKTMVPDAPVFCRDTFGGAALPWPPSPTAVPGQSACLSQRPGVNVAPAIAPDGTIYTVSRAHGRPGSRYGYLIALTGDLQLKWAASLRDRLHDGCGVSLPIGEPGGCRAGTPANGVDPTTNELPAGEVLDVSTASPVVAPDGSVLYGAYTAYNYQRGHLMQFSASGEFKHAFDFGWDTTPAIWEHDGTYSVILKENNYEVGSYCFDVRFCPHHENGPYYITQLDADLNVEWRFRNTNTEECSRQEDGTILCEPAAPGGFEWCINAPAVDAMGNVYANSEDGNLYVIAQGGQLVSQLFLNLALGAAYTPLAIGPDGKIYTENDGIMFVIGN